ncbi:MAG: AAA family ATPase, partial [Candidatus Xenobia bacterium]
MRIAELEVAGFGPFATLRRVMFASDALSLVLGPNESGKSNLVAALFGVLFGLSTEEAERARSWEPGPRFDGSVVLTLEATRIRITRDFVTQQTEIVDLTDPEHAVTKYSGDGKSPEYFFELGKLVGFQDAEIASSTTFISHRDLETRVSDKLRQMISGCKRADYEKILEHLRRQHARITRVDPWPGKERTQDGQMERRQKELERLQGARAEVEEVLGEARRLQHNIDNLKDEIRVMGERVVEDTRTLDGLQLLNLLLREEAQTQERLEHVQEVMETVDTLSRELAEASINRQKFPEFEAYGSAFPDDLHTLAEARKELGRVQKEMEKERAATQRLQGEIKKLQEELTAHYGAFEDLPDDFPERLQLFATRSRDLTALTSELDGIGAQIASLEEDINRTYPRFVRFGEDHADRLHALEAQEKEMRKELRELELEHSMVVDTQGRLKKQTQTLLDRFAAFDSVSEDFPSRLRSYRSLQSEYDAKRSQVDSLTVDIDAMELELGRDFKLIHDVGPDYGDRIDAARLVVERADRELPRLARERDNVQRLMAELEAINSVLKGRLKQLENRTDSGLPERLREYRRLKEEYTGKRKVIDEAQARIQEAQREINAHFSRFTRYSSDWGERLETYRKDAERTEVALDQLRKEEEQYHELRRELDRLEAEAGADAELLESATDDFPELLREFARLRNEVESRVQQIQELKETIKQLEEGALHDYSDYFGVGDDYATRLIQYRTEREHADQVADALKQGSDEATVLHKKLLAVEKTLKASWPQFEGQALGTADKIKHLIELERRAGPLSSEVEETRQRHQELSSQVTRQASGLAGIIGRKNQDKVREVTQLAEQLAALTADFEKVEGEIRDLRASLGKLVGDKKDLTTLLRDLEGYEKAARERQELQSELDSTQALVKKT